jgi:hypothetical protein
VRSQFREFPSILICFLFFKVWATFYLIGRYQTYEKTTNNNKRDPGRTNHTAGHIPIYRHGRNLLKLSEIWHI